MLPKEVSKNDLESIDPVLSAFFREMYAQAEEKKEPAAVSVHIDPEDDKVKVHTTPRKDSRSVR
ncbi:hypothetical protein ISR94_02505 [Candidatus Microgenomates bacterium]|nr:hypothetical protein [Candidatus Microgenomates bacterium]